MCKYEVYCWKCEKYFSCHNIFGCISVSTMKDQTDESVTTIQNGTYTDGIEGSFIIIYLIFRDEYNTLLLNPRP